MTSHRLLLLVPLVLLTIGFVFVSMLCGHDLVSVVGMAVGMYVVAQLLVMHAHERSTR